MWVDGQIGLRFEIFLLMVLHIDLVSNAKFIDDCQRPGRAKVEHMVQGGLCRSTFLGRSFFRVRATGAGALGGDGRGLRRRRTARCALGKTEARSSRQHRGRGGD